MEEAGLIRQEQNGFYTECFIVKEHPFYNIWKLLSGNLNNSMEIQLDLRKMEQVDRHKLCVKKRQ